MKIILTLTILTFLSLTQSFAQTDNIKHKKTSEQQVTSQKKKSSVQQVTIQKRKTPVTKKVDVSYNNGVLSVNGVTYDFVKVQAGSFTMGATPEMNDPLGDSKPTHQVTITNDYYIGKTEVTQALWEMVMGNNPSVVNIGDNKPVNHVSWDECIKFISKLNAMTNKHFCLPTEAEWEFAARGGNESRRTRYSGSNNIDDVSCSSYGSSGPYLYDVATKLPNELGIYDMCGNVREWCFDWYGKYSSESQTNPKGPTHGTERVARDGSMGHPDWSRQPSSRVGFPSRRHDWSIGFRLAISK